jgi:MoxR-like ATPase
VASLSSVMSGADLLAMTDYVKRAVEVSPAVEQYIVALATQTRDLPDVRLGVSPRGSLALLQAARVAAAAAGRTYVTPDDIKALAEPTLAHRIILHPDAEVQGRTSAEVVARTLEAVPVPRTLVR